jgi:hypothetical protein
VADRVVLEVVSVESLPPSARGSRRAVVRWSDGSFGEALRWWDDEVLFCEGDHGNSWLMSSRVEKHGVAGAVRVKRAHNQEDLTTLRTRPST